MPEDNETDLFGDYYPEDFSLEEGVIDGKKKLVGAIEKLQTEALALIDNLQTRLNYLTKTVGPETAGHEQMLGALDRDLQAIQDKISEYQQKLPGLATGAALLSPAFEKQQKDDNFS